MQKVTIPIFRVIKVVYFLAAIAFQFILLFTDVGNYFHGGTPAELVALQVVAVLIVVAAIKLLPRVCAIEKFFVLSGAVVPAISIAWSLISVW